MGTELTDWSSTLFAERCQFLLFLTHIVFRSNFQNEDFDGFTRSESEIQILAVDLCVRVSLLSA